MSLVSRNLLLLLAILQWSALAHCGTLSSSRRLYDPGTTSSSHSESAPEDPVLKGVAEGALSIVALGFAAFTFLYSTLIAIVGDDTRVTALKCKLRRSLYATVFAIVLSAVLSILAFTSLELKLRDMGMWAIGLAVVVLVDLCGIALYLAVDVFTEGRP